MGRKKINISLTQNKKRNLQDRHKNDAASIHLQCKLLVSETVINTKYNNKVANLRKKSEKEIFNNVK